MKNKFNHISNNLPFKSIRSIEDKKVGTELSKIFKNFQQNNKKILNDKNIHNKFLKEYLKWIKSSKNNYLKNLSKFKFLNFSNGSSQIFDYFYSKYKNKRFRAFRGEYAYHYVSWRNNYKNWKYLDNKLDINKNDAVVISLPFSDSGSKHPLMEKLIRICNKKNIPVLVDCCHFAMCKGINFNFNQKSIKEISFSMSKCFPVSRLRIGMRLSKVDNDDPLFFLNKLGLVNKLSVYVGLQLIKKFKFDYIYNKYKDKQIFYCRKMKLKPSNVVAIAIGDYNWKIYNRGGDWNRLCLSSLYEKK